MRRISHDTYAVVFHVVSLVLVTNVMLVIGCLPLVVLLVTTDPARSWPLLAVAAPLAAPAVTAAFTVFGENHRGGDGILRGFLSGLRATWRKSLAVAVMSSVLVVVLLVDVSALSSLTIGVLVVPVLLLLTVMVLSTTLLSLVALAEAPQARIRDVIRAAIYIGLRRWYFTVVSLIVLGLQVALFANAPAIALGVTASAALYLAWANSRYSLRPVLMTEEVSAA